MADAPAAYAALYATPAGAERAVALPPMPSENGLPVTSADAGVPPLGYAIAQLHGIYILAENAEGLIVVDMHAAHERIGYERLKNAHDGIGLQSQPLLVPITLAVGEREADTAESEAETLAALGFEVTRAGPGSLHVRSIPALLAHAEPEGLLRDVLTDLRAWAEPPRGQCPRRTAVDHGLPWRGARQPAPDRAGNERAAARHGDHRAVRPVQPRPAHLGPFFAGGDRPLVPARTLRGASMRYRGMAGLLAAWMLAACSPAPPPAPAVTEDPAYAAAQQWRVARYQDLTRPDGWTALVGLHWLQNTSHFVGSGATNGIRLAVGPDKLGLLRREGTQWWFTPETGVDVSHEGQPVRGRIRVDTDKDAQPTLLAFDGGRASSASSVAGRVMRCGSSTPMRRRAVILPACSIGRAGRTGRCRRASSRIRRARRSPSSTSPA